MRITPNQDSQDVHDLMPELRHLHRSSAAPESLEIVLRAAAESRPAPASAAPQSPLRFWPSWAWALTAAALLLVLVGIGEWSTHHPTPDSPSSDTSHAHHPAAPTPLPNPVPDAVQNTAAPAPLRAASVPRMRRRTPSAPNSIDSQQAWQPEFVALPASEGLPPATAITLVRMHIQQSSLQQYGLEVPAESIDQTLLAEFMVGEDGLPRAIRILQ